MNFFDLHCDTPLILDAHGANMAVDMLNHPFEKYTQTMAVFIREECEDGFAFYRNRLKVIKKYAFNSDIFIAGQGERPENGIMLSVENGAFLADDPELIYILFGDGVRLLSLTWNGDNRLASGANGVGGITQKGKEVIRLMNEVGMVLDVSHLSYKAALEGIALADRVVASHSCLYSCFPHNRNIKDNALIALKEKGGIIGLCFYPEFLGGGDVSERLKGQIDYLLNLDMVNNISIGSDFDGAKMAPKLSKTADVLALYNDFVRLGLKNSLLDRIFYENAIAFFGKMCENK